MKAQTIGSPPLQTRSKRGIRALSLILLATALLGMKSADGVKTNHDIKFTRTDSGALTLDIYRPEGGRKLPVLLLIHGGSWAHGDKSDWVNFAPRFAEAGFLVVVPNYRLAPPGGSTRFPGHLDDLKAALQWVRSNSKKYGGDPKRVGMVGSSAGAHLTILKASSGSTRPDAVALYSPPVDLERLHSKGIAVKAIEALLGCAPEGCPATYQDASALVRLDARTPPVFLAYSEEEILPKAQGRSLRRALEALNVPHRVKVLGGSAHGLGVGRKVFAETVHFMTRVLKAK